MPIDEQQGAQIARSILRGGDAGDGTADDSARSGDDSQGGSEAPGRLGAVMERGSLNCGVNDTIPGFGIVSADGENQGFDIDFCRVVAAAVLGDADAVNYTALDSSTRFPSPQSGQIDVLIRNTTWTASRDGNEQANFLSTTFFDGQDFMVRANSSIQTVADMSNTSICVCRVPRRC